MRIPFACCIAIAAAPAAAPTASASPQDPDDNSWVAIAVSPTSDASTFGGAGNRERATQIAMEECLQRSQGQRCVVPSVTEYGCVAYAVDVSTKGWAGGRGPDSDAAVADAISKAPGGGSAGYEVGSACSDPISPP